MVVGVGVWLLSIWGLVDVVCWVLWGLIVMLMCCGFGEWFSVEEVILVVDLVLLVVV